MLEAGRGGGWRIGGGAVGLAWVVLEWIIVLEGAIVLGNGSFMGGGVQPGDCSNETEGGEGLFILGPEQLPYPATK